MGDIYLKFTSIGKRVRLTNCLFVLELGVNLLFTGKLIEKSVSINSTPKGTSLVAPNSDIIAKGDYSGGLTLFYTDIGTEEQAYISDLNPRIWHQRMGHIGSTALKQLPQATQGVKGFNEEAFNDIPCDTCIQAKASANISRAKPKRASEYLEKVYSDICGPISPETWSKSRYFASYIDDSTRWAEISLLRSKD